MATDDLLVGVLRRAVLQALEGTEGTIETRVERALELALSEENDRRSRAERLAVVGQRAGSVVHELRNPLSVIETSAYLLAQRAGDDPFLARHAKRIGEQVALAAALVEELLDTMRERPLELARMDLRALARSAVEQAGRPTGVALELQMPSQPVWCNADERRLRQVVVNHLLNAFAAIEGEGRVTVLASEDETSVQLQVQDNGPGVRPEHLHRLFEPLFTTKAQGTGLGLALSRALARAHGGELRVHNNEPPPGACFVLSLPKGATP